MGFTQVDSNNNLMASDLANEQLTKKVCYVINTKSGIAANSSAFFTLYVKTADSVVVPVQLFNIENYIQKGLELSSFKGSFIELSGTVTVYRGSYSIIGSDVVKLGVTALSTEDRAKFIGKVPNVDELFGEVNTALLNVDESMKLPVILKTRAYPNIFDGCVGGYVRFINLWMYQLLPYCEEYGGILLKMFYTCVLHYSKYLDRLSTVDFITAIEKLEILKQLDSIEDESLLEGDALQAILRLGSPEHLFAHILFDTFNLVEDIMKKQSMWKRLPVGGVQSLEGKSILKRY